MACHVSHSTTSWQKGHASARPVRRSACRHGWSATSRSRASLRPNVGQGHGVIDTTLPPSSTSVVPRPGLWMQAIRRPRFGPSGHSPNGAWPRRGPRETRFPGSSYWRWREPSRSPGDSMTPNPGRRIRPVCRRNRGRGHDGAAAVRLDGAVWCRAKTRAGRRPAANRQPGDGGDPHRHSVTGGAARAAQFAIRPARHAAVARARARGIRLARPTRAPARSDRTAIGPPPVHVRRVGGH